MRTACQLIIGIVTTLAFASLASGQYVLRSDGYYYNGNQAYTRNLSLVRNGYYAGGCYYPPVYQASYTAYYPPAPAYVPPAPALPSYTDINWKTKLLDLAMQRDKYELATRASLFEQQAFAESIRLLGLENNFRIANYGQAVPYVAPYYNAPMPGAPGYTVTGHAYSNTYPVNAQTVYGYNSLAAMYGDTNINQLFQMMSQHVAGAQRLQGDATQQFGQIVGQEGANRAKIAEFLAKAEVTRQILQALQDPATAKGYTFKISPAGQIEKNGDKVPEADKAALRQQWGDLAAEKCGSCHVGKDAKGGFQLDSYLNMTQAEKQNRVWARIFSNDPKTMMPRKEDGSAGVPLTEAEKRLWLVN